LKPDQEVTVSIEAGKTLVIRFLATGQARPDGTRTLFFELNGQPREINIRDHSLRVVTRTHPKADPADPGQVGAATAGMVTKISVELNQVVERQAKLITIDAMKMQSNIYAPIAGRISKLHVALGDHVEAKDLLITIAT
jgi:pyruvate carboxylase